MKHERIITSSLGGQPVIRNTQAPVYEVLARLAQGMSPAEILRQWPGLELVDVQAALAYAAEAMRQPAKLQPKVAAESIPDQELTELNLKKILLIDDDDANRLLIQTILRDSGFTLSVAADGTEGWAKAQAELPFLIISDIQMPGMSGLQLLMKLKADERTKNAGVILVTAHRSDSQQISQGLTLGADDYVVQPFKRDEFLARLGAVTRIKWAEAEARRQARAVAQRNKGLALVNELAVAVNSSLDLQKIFASAMQKLSQLLDAEAVSLLLLEEDAKLVVNISSRMGEQISTSIRLSPETAATPLEAQAPAILSNILNDPQFKIGAELTPSAETTKYIPMTSKEQVIGVIAILNQRRGDLTKTEQVLLHSAAGIIAVAVENARLFSAEQDFSMHLEQMVVARTSELAAEQEKTEAILASMADGLVVLDPEKRILTINAVAEGMLDFYRHGETGQAVSPEQWQHPLWLCLEAMTDSLEPTISRAVDLPAPDGTTLSIQAHSAKVRNETGQVIGTVIVLRDITTLKEVERMKARFMAGVTHELKTPLAVIKLHSKNLLTYHARLSETKRVELLHSIQAQVDLLEKFIENILDVSRFDAGALKIERQPVNLTALISRVVAGFGSLAAAKQITLRWQESATEMAILADPNQMERVVRNLIDNALKYTPAGGSVDVKNEPGLKDDRPVVKIIVSDTGPGIALEHQLRIFDRFYRIDPSHTIPGTGLGLAIVKEMVNAHGGEIHLESMPGRGSTFIVTLPGNVTGETTSLPGS